MGPYQGAVELREIFTRVVQKIYGLSQSLFITPLFHHLYLRTVTWCLSLIPLLSVDLSSAAAGVRGSMQGQLEVRDIQGFETMEGEGYSGGKGVSIHGY